MKTKKHQRGKKNITQSILQFVKIPKYNPSEIQTILKVPENDIDEELKKMFHYNSPSILPQDDYYGYITNDWVKNMKNYIKTHNTYYVKQDDVRIIQANVCSTLVKLTLDYVEKSKDKRVKQVYTSFKECHSSLLKKHIQQTTTDLETILNTKQFMDLLVYLNKMPIINESAPITWTMDKNLKNPKVYSNYLYPGTLTFYDYSLYEDFTKTPTPADVKHKKEYLRLYEIYIQRIFKECMGIDNFNSSIIFNCERNLLTCFVGGIEEKEFNNITSEECLSDYGFDWEEFTKQMGFNNTPKQITIGSLNYFKNIVILMKKWNSPEWKFYWYYICFRQMIKFSKTLRYIHYDFVGKFVYGVIEPYPDKLNGLFGLSLCYNTLLSNLYIKEFYNVNVINYIKNLTHELQNVFIHIIQRNKWLSPPTKKKALLKLHHLKFHYACVDLQKDPVLPYTEDAWHNLSLITEYRFNKLMTMDGKGYIIDSPTIDWNQYPPNFSGTQCYVVNAYYTPTSNSIFFPLGYLQEPMINLNESFEYNLAFMGYTISHEMSHSLDNSGSRYDYKGALNNWWTDADRKYFNSIVKNIVKQYEVFAAYDGITWDATNSVGEDMADISGLAIIEEYLRNNIFLNNTNKKIAELDVRKFFAYYAQANRQNIYKKAIAGLLITNPHPMNKYRTNCPLARLSLFRYIFKVKKGDLMYWEDTKKIW